MQAATHSQSYNRYSYTFNNPLNATDPSGYIAWAPILKAAAWIAGSYAAGDYGRRNNLPWLGQVASIAGCIYGYCASAAFGSTYGATQNLGVAIIAGVSAGAMSGMNPAARFLMSGVLGGTASVMMGDEYGHGFVSAGLGTLAGSADGDKLDTGGLIVSAVVGGTVSEMTGGKFKNGAASAAFSYAVSWAAQKYGAGVKTPMCMLVIRHQLIPPKNRAVMQKEIDTLLIDGTLSQSQGFKTADEAATSVLEKIPPLSKKYGIEVGGNIYKGKDGLYHHTLPKMGDSILIQSGTAIRYPVQVMPTKLVPLGKSLGPLLQSCNMKKGC